MGEKMGSDPFFTFFTWYVIHMRGGAGGGHREAPPYPD